MEDLKKIKPFVIILKFHLESSVWNALVVKNKTQKNLVNCLIPFPFVCQRTWVHNRFCLLADKATIHRLKNTENFREGMRQVGYLAATGIL
jgi:hypothetical protein